MSLLDVPVHLQDHHGWCGPACAQMVATFLGSPLTEQDGSHIPSKPKNWFTTPEQLEKLINVLRPENAPPYTTIVEDTFARAMAHVTASLNARFPAVVLVDGGEHWVVVRGVTGGGQARFVHRRDPFPDRDLVLGSRTPLPLHAESDDCDEADQLAGADPNRRGLSDEVVRWNEWKISYFSACKIAGKPWHGKRVVIVADLKEIPEPEPEDNPLPLPELPLTESVAIDCARRALIASELATEDGWADAIQGPVLTAQAHAIRVERLDGGAPYFLVVLTDGEGKGVVAQLDGVTGELIGARLMSRRVAKSLLAPVPVGHRRFVWRATRNSFDSPYYPFSEIPQPSGPPIYQRTLDQKTFHDLRHTADHPD